MGSISHKLEWNYFQNLWYIHVLLAQFLNKKIQIHLGQEILGIHPTTTWLLLKRSDVLNYYEEKNSLLFPVHRNTGFTAFTSRTVNFVG